jgi:hypothetical protein
MHVGSLVFATDQGRTGVYAIINRQSKKWYVAKKGLR